MNGFSLLLTLASLSVVYSWRTGVDQQQEYVLQIEPEIVQLLLTPTANGQPEEIFSDIPADAGPFQRLCISILPKDGIPARHTAAAEEQFRQLLISAGRYASRDRTLPATDPQPTIAWPGRAGGIPEQSYGVTTGWQADSSGNQQYLVQIDPTVLQSLSIGDELYVPIDPAAGRPVRFIVKAGRGNLPRAGGVQNVAPGQVPFTPLAQQPLQPIGGNNRPGGWTNSTAPDLLRQPPRPNPEYTNNLPPVNYNNPPPQANVPAGGYAPYPQQPQQPQGSAYDPYRNPAGEMPPQYPVQPVAGQPPAYPPNQYQRPYNNPYPETRVAGLPPAPVSNTNGNQFGTGGFSPTLPLQNQQDKPWGPLLFVTFALFFSIGGNLYLAYTALEFHSRYRSAIERLRSAARAP
jgi:hypothetical protein